MQRNMHIYVDLSNWVTFVYTNHKCYGFPLMMSQCLQCIYNVSMCSIKFNDFINASSDNSYTKPFGFN